MEGSRGVFFSRLGFLCALLSAIFLFSLPYVLSPALAATESPVPPDTNANELAPGERLQEEAQGAAQGKAPAEAQGETPAEAQGEAPAEAQGEAPAEAQGEAETEPQGEAPAEPQGEAQAEPQGEAQAEPQGEAQAEPQGEAQEKAQGEAQEKPQEEAQEEAPKVVEEPACTTGLRDAINAAISQIHSHHFIPNELMRRFVNAPYVPLLACPPYPGASDPSFWPSLSSVHHSDLLLKVFERGKLRVASYGPEPPKGQTHPEGKDRAFVGYNWKEEGNYSQEPFDGFLPTYLKHLVEVIGVHYERPLKVEWVFYTTGEACIQSVLRGDTDMTDIYFLQAIPEDSDESPVMVEQFYRTCPVLASSNVFVTRADLKVKTLQEIVARIRSRWSNTPVAYLTHANYLALRFLLPEDTPFTIMRRERALAAVRKKNVLGIFMTGSLLPIESKGLTVVPTHVFSSMGPWLRRTDTPRCLSHRFKVDFAAETSRASLSTGTPADSAADTPSTLLGLSLAVLLSTLYVASR